MELPAPGVLVGDPCLQSLHVTVGDPIQCQNQTPGKRGATRQGEALEGQQEQDASSNQASTPASQTGKAQAKNHGGHFVTSLIRHVQQAV